MANNKIKFNLELSDKKFAHTKDFGEDMDSWTNYVDEFQKFLGNKELFPYLKKKNFKGKFSTILLEHERKFNEDACFWIKSEDDKDYIENLHEDDFDDSEDDEDDFEDYEDSDDYDDSEDYEFDPDDCDHDCECCGCLGYCGNSAPVEKQDIICLLKYIFDTITDEEAERFIKKIHKKIPSTKKDDPEEVFSLYSKALFDMPIDKFYDLMKDVDINALNDNV